MSPPELRGETDLEECVVSRLALESQVSFAARMLMCVRQLCCGMQECLLAHRAGDGPAVSPPANCLVTGVPAETREGTPACHSTPSPRKSVRPAPPGGHASKVLP